MKPIVEYKQRPPVGIITLNNPPVNALSASVREILFDILLDSLADPLICALVLMGRGDNFCGGADIREFGLPGKPNGPNLPDLIDKIDNSSKPVVAAIHGNVLGGGFELSLGCHYRIAMSSAHLGCPEVKLGLIPGAGGTQRLPRLIGIEAALKIIVGGEPVNANEALSLGLLDEIVEDELLDAACSFAEKLIVEQRPLRRLSETNLKPTAENKRFITETRERITKQARGLIAPFLGIESVANSLSLPFPEALEKERIMFERCLDSAQSAAQRHVFFAERKAAKDHIVTAGGAVMEIQNAAVIGAGTMGRGIAMSFANAGIPVIVLDCSPENLDRGLAAIQANYTAGVRKKRIPRASMDKCMELISGTLHYRDLANADIVIEAVYEDLQLKQNIFRELSKVCKAETILTTNTSTLDVNQIASTATHPENVMGTHFFSPANIMKLVENVRADRTSERTIAAVMKLCKSLGKVGVVVGLCDGFVANRMLYAYTKQANFLLEEGALPQQLDKYIFDFGFPMGPFAMGDLAGLDVGWRIRQHQSLTKPNHERYSIIADRICEMGRFGQKTGAGWYRYKQGSRTPINDPLIENLIISISKGQGIKRRSISDQEILERCIYTMINEGAKILDEGFVRRASDIDVIWIYGYGFPKHRGGPMFYADAIGLKKIYNAMSQLYDIHGELLRPATLLSRLAKTGKNLNAHKVC